MQALWYLIDTISSFFGSALLLRGYMNWLGLRGRDPISQFVIAVTDWCVLPLRKLLPARGRWDTACFVAAFIVAVLAAMAVHLLVGDVLGAFSPLTTLRALGSLISWGLMTAMLILILSAVLSWVNPQAPMAPALDALASPILDPIRRVVPLMGGVDLSPVVAIIGIQFLQMLTKSLFSGSFLLH